MKIGGVVIEDFLVIEKAGFNLDSCGLIGLRGENKDDTSADSNGSGKSSLVEAIYWCLWNQTPRGVTGDDIIRNGAKNTIVKVELIDDDGVSWFVERERRKGKGKLYLKKLDPKVDIVRQNISLGTEKLTQALIEKLLGSSEEVFKAAVMIGQEALVDLASLTDKKLKELIEEAAGVSVLEQAYVIARENENILQKKGIELATALDVIQNEIIILTNQIDTATITKVEWEDKNKQTIDAIENDIYQITTELEENREYLDANRSEYETAIDSNRVIGVSLNDYSIRRAALDKAEKKLSDAIMETQRTALQLKTTVAQLMEVKGKLVSITSSSIVGSVCEECGSVINADNANHIHDNAALKLAQIERDMTRQRTLWDAHRGAQELASVERDNLASTMGDVSTLTAERANNEATIHAYERVANHKATQEITLKRAEDELNRSKAFINPYDAIINSLTVELQKANLDLHEKGKEYAEQSVKLADAIDVTALFSPKGVRAEILDEVTPYLNDRTSEYLGVLSDGNIEAVWSTLQRNAKGEMKERFAIDVNKIGAGGNFNSLSGGEKRKVRLACALALQDLVASRATKPFSLWIGDEIEAGLDTAGLERLMTVLSAKASDKGTVVIISHSDLRDWIDNVWTMQMSGGKSELVT